MSVRNRVVAVELAAGEPFRLQRECEPEVPVDDALRRATEPLAPLCVDAAGLGLLIGVSERSVYRLHDAGRIPAAIKLGGATRWHVETIVEWLRAGAPPRRQWEAKRS